MKNDKSKFFVLVVEDDELLLETIISILDESGYGVINAENGEEALEVIKSHPVHFILSDIRMPKKTGIDLLKDVRNLYPEIPYVLLMSGFADVTPTEVKQLGAIDLINKPSDLPLITDIIDTYYKDHSST